MYRYKIIVEYDGSPFAGWQRQNGLDTIQQRLEETLLSLSKKPVILHGAGRTDAGVHALRQTAHFDMERDIDCFRVLECMNAHLLNIPIGVLSVEKVTEDFDARFSAIERTYIYKILNRRTKPCIDAQKVWHVIQKLDEGKMNTAAQCLVGKHDFSSFRAAGCQSKSPIKTANNIAVERKGDIIFLEISAKSFLYHQVRNIVGSLVLVGIEKWSRENFEDLLIQKDRKKAGMTAPACGLYLSNVIYP